MPETVVGRTADPQIPRLGAAAKGKGNDVVKLQQEAGPATPPAVRIDETAAASVAAPHLAPGMGIQMHRMALSSSELSG